MPGLLADVNVQGHLEYLQHLIDKVGLLEMLRALDLALATFPDLDLDRHIKDRPLWEFCQANGWVLFTDNRKAEEEDSLEATLQDSWHEGHLPVITLANKGRFEHSEIYATRVAEDIAEVLFRVFGEKVLNQPRIYVPIKPVN